MKRHQTSAWKLDLPITLSGGPVSKLTNPEFTTMAVYRGWVGGAPLSVSVSTRSRAGATLRSEGLRLRAFFHNSLGSDIEISVPGSRGARRVDGKANLEEGLGDAPDWTEQITSIVAARGKEEFVVLTVRRRPEELADQAEAIISSFALV